MHLTPITATVCYLVREKNGHITEVGMAWKEPTPSSTKLRIANHWNGWGGKLEKDDSSIEGRALLELCQESGVIATPKQIEKVGVVTYRREGVKDCICHIFLARVPNADPRPTPEMSKPTWFRVEEIPYKTMMAGDALTLPPILAGKRVTAVITYDEDMNVITDKTVVEIV